MLTWNEIRTRAAPFAERWADATKENAEAQTFWNEFLQVFGIDRHAREEDEEEGQRLSHRSTQAAPFSNFSKSKLEKYLNQT